MWENSENLSLPKILQMFYRISKTEPPSYSNNNSWMLFNLPSLQYPMLKWNTIHCCHLSHASPKWTLGPTQRCKWVVERTGLVLGGYKRVSELQAGFALSEQCFPWGSDWWGQWAEAEEMSPILHLHHSPRLWGMLNDQEHPGCSQMSSVQASLDWEVLIRCVENRRYQRSSLVALF